MEELQHFQTSWLGYQAHTTKLLAGITNDGPFDKLTVTLIIERLQHKQTILEDLDSKIAPLMDDEVDLEVKIVKAEETRTRILDSIAQLKLKLNCPSTDTKLTEPQPPVLKNPTSAPLSAASDPPVSNISTSHTVSP